MHYWLKGLAALADRSADIKNFLIIEIFSEANFTRVYLNQEWAETFQKFAMDFKYDAGGLLDKFLKFSSKCILGLAGIPFWGS